MYAGNDYSDEPNKSGGQDNEAASGKLLEKFSKFKPTRTKDGGRKFYSHKGNLTSESSRHEIEHAMKIHGNSIINA